MRADTTKETTIGTCPACKQPITATVRYVVETGERPREGGELAISVTAKPIGLTMRHTCDTTKGSPQRYATGTGEGE